MTKTERDAIRLQREQLKAEIHAVKEKEKLRKEQEKLKREQEKKLVSHSLSVHVCLYISMYMYIRLFEQVEEKMLPSSLHFFSTLPQVLCSVIDVQRVIEFVATCFLCRGQDDERYISLISERKGKFMDATGT